MIVAAGVGITLALRASAGWVPAPAAMLDRMERASAFSIAPNPHFSQLVVFDADGDGDLDAWHFAEDRGVRFQNVGTPRNARWQPLPGSPFPDPIPAIRHAAPVDADGDGDDDFIVIMQAKQQVLRLIRNTGTASQPVWELDPTPVSLAGLPSPGFKEPPALGTGDLDGDGLPDLLMAGTVRDTSSSSGYRLKIYRAERVPCGSGSCWSPFSFLADLNPSGPQFLSLSTMMMGIHIVDLNGDGAPEIIASGRFYQNPTSGGEGFAVLPNLGTPTAPAWGVAQFSFEDPGHPDFFGLKGFPTQNASFADIDADGDTDLFTYRGFFRNTGTATAPQFPDQGDLNTFTIQTGEGGEYARPVCEDIDRDGDLDLFVLAGTSTAGTMHAFQNDGTPFSPAWTSVSQHYADWTIPGWRVGCRFADLDGDGDRDAWFGDSDGMMLSIRSGTASAPVWSTPTNAHGIVSLVGVKGLDGFDWADVDGDGDEDLLNADPYGGIHLWRNTGAPGAPDFSDEDPDFLGFDAAFPEGWLFSPVVTDINGDGRDDVAVLNHFFDTGPPSRLLAAMGNGSGFDPPVSLLEFDTAGGTTIELADLNGDGLADLLSGGYRGGIQLFLQTGATAAVSPDRISTTPGATHHVQFSGAALSAWSFVTNASGGTINPASGEYTAGPAAGVDVIQAIGVGGTRARAYVNVIPAAESAAFGKAILIAGAKGATDPAWPATDRMSRKAYDALRLLGYTKENILFLNFLPGRDLDGNGLDDDIDGAATGAAAAAAFTTFATNATRLVVGLWDHGASGGGGDFMRLNPSETLAAAQLDAWLDAWQAADTNRECGVVLEFCQSGSFLDDLANGASNRFVAASCATNQLAYFIAQGLVSFSDSFFAGEVQGLDFGACFDLARASMSAYQAAQLDDNGDGVFDPDTDGAASAGFHFGARYTAGRNVPQIARISPNQDVSGSSPVTLWAADIASPNAITRVWAVVVPPTHQPDPALANPVTDLPELDLFYNAGTGRYEADFAGFSDPGSYAVIFFAQDVWGGVSVPRQSFISQSGLTERVILVGGQSDDPVTAAGLQDATRRAYATLRARRIPAADIRWLSATPFEDTDGDTTNDVHAAVSSAALEEAVRTWAAGVDRLTLLLIAEGTNNQARLSGPSDLLAAASLKAWLDNAAATNQTAQILLDFSGSGAFIPALHPAPAGQRMIMASTAAGRFSVIEPGISLTSVIMAEIFSGRSVGASVSSGRKVMRRMSGGLRQVALLDSDGDGVANEKNVDDPIARAKYLGAGFVTGDDSPVIGRVTPDQIGVATTPVVLFAEDVIDADGIAAVWAEIAGPGSEPGAATRRVDLPPDGPGRWAATDSGMVSTGLHAIAFFAEDTLGNRSVPVVTRIERVELAAGSPPDACEVDDDPLLSRIVDLPLEEIHTLHVAPDEDWVRFYASSSLVYDIATTHLTNTIDTVLEIYAQSPGGALTLVDRVDDFGADEGEWTGLDFPADGIYAVRVTHASGEPFAPGAYELSITVPAGLLNGITIYVADALGSPSYISGATVRFRATSGALLATRVSNAGGIAEYETARGDYLVEVEPPSGAGWRSYLGEEVISIAASEFRADSLTRLLGVSRAAIFFKAATVTGRVETATPGEGVPGAAIRLLGPGGALTRYPATSAGIPWSTDGAGRFPRSVTVPAGADYSAEITATAYQRLLLPIGTLTPGETRDLGALALAAADANNNQVPDPWEYHWFNGLVDVSLDPDHDRASHRQEYIAGTDPTLPTSAFRILPAATSAPFLLTWQPVAGRRYRIHRMTGFPSGAWTEQYLSPVAGTDPPPMEWTDPAPAGGAVYRIDAELP